MDKKEAQTISQKMVSSNKQNLIQVDLDNFSEYDGEDFDYEADAKFGGQMNLQIGWHNSEGYDIEVLDDGDEVSLKGVARLKRLLIESPSGETLLLRCHIL